MGKLIYCIGGASASGKSMVTKKLLDISGHQTVALDDLYNFIRVAMNDLKASQDVTRKITIDIIKEFLSFETSCILEGGWILPVTARELMDQYGEQFYPIFCGYPNANVSKRVKLIKSGNVHWLCETSQEYCRNWIQGQIEESRWYQDECTKYKLPFFDFSDVEEGSKALITNYMEWYQAEYDRQMKSPLKNSVKKSQKFSLTRIQNFLGRLTKQ